MGPETQTTKIKVYIAIVFSLFKRNNNAERNRRVSHLYGKRLYGHPCHSLISYRRRKVDGHILFSVSFFLNIFAIWCYLFSFRNTEAHTTRLADTIETIRYTDGWKTKQRENGNITTTVHVYHSTNFDECIVPDF